MSNEWQGKFPMTPEDTRKLLDMLDVGIRVRYNALVEKLYGRTPTPESPIITIEYEGLHYSGRMIDWSMDNCTGTMTVTLQTLEDGKEP